MPSNLLIKGEKVTPQEILQARDSRREMQRTLVGAGNGVLICMTLNIPGNIKVFEESRKTFRMGSDILTEQLSCRGESIDQIHINEKKTGYELFIKVRDCNPYAIKRLCVDIEERCTIGRLLDIDVISKDGNTISRTELGYEKRKCLVCGCYGHECTRSRRHDVVEVLTAIINLVNINI